MRRRSSSTSRTDSQVRRVVSSAPGLQLRQDARYSRLPGAKPCNNRDSNQDPNQKGVSMTVTDEYLQNNAAYAAQFSGPLPLPPSKHVAVLACMDARLDVYRDLGIEEGESHVIRNAGGVVTDDEIRSLAISQRLLGTKEIILSTTRIAECSRSRTTSSSASSRTRSASNRPGRPNRSPTSTTTFGNPTPNREQSVHHSNDSLRGFVFDVATGKLNEVLPA